MKAKLISLLILLTASNALFVLKAQNYVPMDTSTVELRKEKSAFFTERAKAYTKYIEDNYRGDERKVLKEHFEKVNKKINEDILAGDFVFSDKFDAKIKEIANELISKNPSLPSDLEFLLTRELSVNAASMGNRNFILNMGSFYYLDKEDLLAAMIAHEMAHLLLNHSTKDILANLYQKKDDKLKDEVRQIKKDKNSKSDKAYSKLKDLLYENGRKNKNQEFEADSAGYLLYKNTKYNPKAYVASYAIMAEYDTIKPLGLKEDIYRKYFNLPNQPFNEKWLAQEDFSQYDYSKYKERFNQDSLSSHPEMQERVKMLQAKFPELNFKDEKITYAENKTYDELSDIAGKERLSDLMHLEEYGIGVYYSLLRLQKGENLDYYKEWLGKFLDKIYIARKEYKLNRYLEQIDPKEQSESYRQFLSFMWNLNLTEIKTMADYYTKKGS